jgi:LysR family glycine cleavage system transcriptional activator
MRMSFGDAPVGTRQEMIEFLHAAVDRGITFFDTAEVYGPFTNEDLVGEGQQKLQLAVCSTFGPGWLTERLEDFYRSYPEIDLELRLYAQNPLFANEVADAYVVADELKAGYTAIPLKEELLIAIEAPASKQQAKGATTHRLITTDPEPDRLGQDWIDYCRVTGTRLSDIQDGSFRLCSHYFLALELAKAGQGIALIPDFLAAREIRSGTVTAYDDALIPSGRTYHLCIRETRANEAKLKKLTDWLVSTVAKDVEQPDGQQLRK